MAFGNCGGRSTKFPLLICRITRHGEVKRARSTGSSSRAPDTASRRPLRLVLLILRLDRLARPRPLGVAPFKELVERAAVHEVCAAVDRDGLAGEELALV